jgi:hypothetical protein
MIQLSREIFPIGNGRKKARGKTRRIFTHVLVFRGRNPTTMLLEEQVINIGLVINWSNMMYWRHVDLSGL